MLSERFGIPQTFNLIWGILKYWEGLRTDMTMFLRLRVILRQIQVFYLGLWGGGGLWVLEVGWMIGDVPII